MATLLKQSTLVTIRLGPFLDITDGVTEEVALGSMGIEVSKNHAAFGARNSATATAHDAEGWYSCELDATDTNTLGPLIVKAHAPATHLPVWREFMVVPAQIYDSFVALTDLLQVDGRQWLNAAVAVPTVAGVPEVDVTHWRGTEIAAGRLNTAQGGAAGSITLDTGASAVNDTYNGMWIVIVGGTGAGQARLISDYVGATKAATTTPNWGTTPDSTSIFAIFNTVN